MALPDPRWHPCRVSKEAGNMEVGHALHGARPGTGPRHVSGDWRHRRRAVRPPRGAGGHHRSPVNESHGGSEAMAGGIMRVRRTNEAAGPANPALAIHVVADFWRLGHHERCPPGKERPEYQHTNGRAKIIFGPPRRTLIRNVKWRIFPKRVSLGVNRRREI
jgi:hypothetical protein